MTDVGWAAVGVSEVHKQGYLELDALDDGEPVQLPPCWPDVVSWRKLQNDPGSGVLSTLQWGYGRPRQGWTCSSPTSLR